MAEPKKQQQARRETESLAAQIYARMAPQAAQRGKTYEAVAHEAVAAARAFERVMSELANEPTG